MKPQDSIPNIQEPFPKSKAKLIASIIIVAIILLTGVIWAIVAYNSQKPVAAPSLSDQAAKALLSDAFKTAAAKSLVRLDHAQQQYQTKNDLQASQPKSQTYSTAEFDLATKDYRAVFATNRGGPTHFTAVRCLGGKAFRSAAEPVLVGYKTLDEVRDALKQPFTKEISGDDYCSLTDPRHFARLTDGIIPIGLNQSQSTAWLEKIFDTAKVTITDAGLMTYRQKTVSFFDVVKNTTGLQLIDPSFAPGPDSYRLEKMATNDTIDGFYLIDEKSKLPVYSEFTSSSLLTGKERLGAGGVFKQAYSYPTRLTLGPASTLEILK